jgi:hypothetical protein
MKLLHKREPAMLQRAKMCGPTTMYSQEHTEISPWKQNFNAIISLVSRIPMACNWI